MILFITYLHLIYFYHTHHASLLLALLFDFNLFLPLFFLTVIFSTLFLFLLEVIYQSLSISQPLGQPVVGNELSYILELLPNLLPNSYPPIIIFGFFSFQLQQFSVIFLDVALILVLELSNDGNSLLVGFGHSLCLFGDAFETHQQLLYFFVVQIIVSFCLNHCLPQLELRTDDQITPLAFLAIFYMFRLDATNGKGFLRVIEGKGNVLRKMVLDVIVEHAPMVNLL